MGVLLSGGLATVPAHAGSEVSDVHGTARVLDVTADNTADGSSDTYRLGTDRLRAGLVDVRLHNAGTVDHQVQLVRLHDGVTADAYRRALIASQGGAALQLGDAMGGSNAIAPGGFQETWVDLPAGSYVAMCFLDGGGGVPHFVKGMLAAFTVVGQGNSAHPPGHVLATISAFSFGFQMPAVVDGHGLYRFTNTAPSDTHELTLIKLVPGATADQAKAWIENPSGPPPFAESAGGAGALAPGGEAWLAMNLTPGSYVAVCFVPDDEPPHAPHAALGMVQGFTVSG
ncbi:MAG: hypothetical protein WCD35_08235 [Mycobacteriales bacterium]